MMKKGEYYQLTIRFWPKAVENNVPPVELHSSNAEFYSDNNIGGYIPHMIDFDYPPSRAELLEIVNRTPWMQHAWSESLLPILAINDWPILSTSYKAAQVNLCDLQKREIGRLQITRKELYENQQQIVPFISYNEVRKVVRYLAKDKRDEAIEYLQKRENWVKEQAVLQHLMSESDRSGLWKYLLWEQGFLKTKPAKIKPMPIAA